MDEKQFQELVAKVGKEAAEQIKAQVEAATKDMVTKSDLDKLQKTIDEFSIKADDIKIGEKSMTQVLADQGTLLKEIQAAQSMQIQGRGETLEMQIKSWMETNKDAIERIKNGSKAELPQMHLKAAITMTNGTSLNSSPYLPNVQVAPGIVDLVRVQPTFWERLPKGRTSANPYVWINKTNKQGNAAFIGEGVLKPLASFELETETSVPKKVAERMKASREILYDVPGMESFIRDELRFEVMTAANTAVLTGTASSTSPAGITTIASTYNLTTINTTDPNNFDAIVAAYTQIRTLNFTGEIEAFMNPVDIANMKLSKGTNGQYVLPPFITANGMTVSGVQVNEDNNIAQGYLLIGVMRLYRILMYQDFFIEWGWENDDFSKNLITVIGEMRFHQFFSANHTGAWIYDTFDNIKTAILPPTE